MKCEHDGIVVEFTVDVSDIASPYDSRRALRKYDQDLDLRFVGKCSLLRQGSLLTKFLGGRGPGNISHFAWETCHTFARLVASQVTFWEKRDNATISCVFLSSSPPVCSSGISCCRSNCDPKAANILRQHYERPYFLPAVSESSRTDWIFMGSPGYGAHLHVSATRSSRRKQ